MSTLETAIDTVSTLETDTVSTLETDTVSTLETDTVSTLETDTVSTLEEYLPLQRWVGDTHEEDIVILGGERHGFCHTHIQQHLIGGRSQ